MFFSNKELADFWSAEKSTQAKLNYLQEFNLSEKSIRFLVEVGLPKELDIFCFLKFDLDQTTILKLSKVIKPDDIKSKKEIDYLHVLGFADDDPICLDVSNGQVCSFNVGFENPFCFINSSIKNFSSSLMIYQQHQKKAEDENLYSDDNKYNLLVHNFESNLKLIDDKSVEENSWWAGIIEQMYDGLI